MSKSENYQTIKANSIAIAKTAKEVGKEIHNQCLVIAKFIADPANNGDVSLASHFVKLLNNDRKSIVRSDAVRLWFEGFAFCKWGKQKDGTEGFKLSAAALKHIQTDDAEAKKHWTTAKATPWYSYAKEKPFVVFDFDKALASLVKRANEKATESGPNGEKNKVNLEHVAKVRELAKEIGIEV